MEVLEQCFKQAEQNLRQLGYKEKEIYGIISHLRGNSDLIPYDNDGNIEFITPDNFMLGNEKALREFLEKYRQICGNRLLVYMMLSTYSTIFSSLHSFLYTIVPDNNEEVHISEVMCFGRNQYRVGSLVFNSSAWSESEDGIILAERTENNGLVRIG